MKSHEDVFTKNNLSRYRTSSRRQHSISQTAERYAFVLGTLVCTMKANKVDNWQTLLIMICAVTAVKVKII